LALLLVLLASTAASLAMSSCSPRHDPAAELEVQIARYRKDPSDALASRIDADFARLDADVAEIRAEAATKTDEARAAAVARADALEQKSGALRKEYYSARVAVVGDAAKNAVKQFGASVGKSIEDAGEKMKNALGGSQKSE
jgi:hypothetical protein